MARRLVYKGSLNGTGPVLKPYEVNANQTIYTGDIVVLSTNKASVAAAEAAAGTVLGVANSDSTAGENVFVDINPASIYEMAFTGTGTPAIGNKYDLETAAYVFDVTDTANGYIQVVGNVDTDNGVADVNLCNRVFGMA